MALRPPKIILGENTYKTEITTISSTTGRRVDGLNMGANEGVDISIWIQEEITLGNITVPAATTVIAENGLYKTVNAIRMGGPLIENTDINTDTYNFTIGSSRGKFNFTVNGLEATTVGDLGGVGAILQRVIASPTNKLEYTPYNFPIADPGVGTYNLVNDGAGGFTFTSVGAGVVNSIYTADDTLAGTRVVTQSTFALTFVGNNKFTAGNGTTLLEVFPTGSTVKLGDINSVGNDMGFETIDSASTTQIGNLTGGGTHIQVDDS